jgi:hypothetical protein
MKMSGIYRKVALGVLVGAGSLALVACDWTSGDDGINTSQGNADINFSGTYDGRLADGRAVAVTSGRSISRLVLSQSDDTLTVTDSNGSTYRGRITGVSTVTLSANDAIGAGQQVAQSQVTWSGVDNAAGQQVQFVGNISAVAVTDIQGSSSGTSESSSSDFNLDTGSVVVSSGSSSSNTVSSTYQLTAQNTQYRLRGNWVEAGGRTSNVDALAAGSASVITTTTTAAE